MKLTKKDIEQLINHGLTVDEVLKQVETITNGIPYLDIVTPASVGNGIELISDANQHNLINYYEKNKEGLVIVKFIPASGASTRMFNFLYHFMEDYNSEEETLNSYLKKSDNDMLSVFFKSFNDFAFVNSVRKKIRENYPDFKHGSKGMRSRLFVKTMLDENGLNYTNLPKGLIPFHKYKKYFTTAFEEHLYESTFYASVNDNAYLHFTFSEKHVPFFKKEFEGVNNRVSKKTKHSFDISYSFQKKETDTIALNKNGKLLRDENKKIVFRPSGHGALIENLNDIDADLIFIKNIDNVTAEDYVDEIAFYKKVLAGKLLWLQEKVFSYIKQLIEASISEDILNEIRSFLWNELNIKETPSDFIEIIQILNRPLRVCGVVKNTGAPGGGPFWIKNNKGITSLQIVEMSQIDDQDPRQNLMVQEATHFNPVDIVCGLKDYSGKKFDLSQFIDASSGIISQKSQDGKPIRALELPGLWNGAMAGWNSAYVEVPLKTFNPVKTVNDLLNKEHRPNA